MSLIMPILWSKEFAQSALAEYVEALGIKPGEFDDLTQISDIYRRDARLADAASGVDPPGHCRADDNDLYRD